MHTLKVIARMNSGFTAKFGIPRQSNILSTRSTIVFEPEYRMPEALRGLEGFSHIWLIWNFSESEGWSPTVRPPRLGGNVRMGVFATRAPYRPNALGLSAVEVEEIRFDTPHGPVIHVRGADLMDNTPIYDIKPYVPYTDSHPEALGGFADDAPTPVLKVEIPEGLLDVMPEELRQTLPEILSYDPRPRYQNAPKRIYGMEYAGYEIKFTVEEDVLKVREVYKV